MATKRARVTVNMVPSDADWLRHLASSMEVSLSKALQHAIGLCRQMDDEEEQRSLKKLRRECRAIDRELAAARQLELFQSEVLH